MSDQLTEQEIREAAAEAGISPAELRQALAGGGPNLPARTTPGDTGVSVYKAETTIARPPEDAVEAVRRAIERQVGARGHRQGAGRADIVDEGRGLVYRVHGQADGTGGALVRVDVDPSAGAGSSLMFGVLVGGVALSILSLGFLFGAGALIGVGVLIGLAGGIAMIARQRRLALGTRDGQAIVARALLEAEDAAPEPQRALGAGS